MGTAHLPDPDPRRDEGVMSMRDEADSQGRAAGQAGVPDPLCFVLMPFGRKSDATGAIIDFDAV